MPDFRSTKKEEDGSQPAAAPEESWSRFFENFDDPESSEENGSHEDRQSFGNEEVFEDIENLGNSESLEKNESLENNASFEDSLFKETYDIAFNAMNKAYSEAAFLAAAERFRSISGYRDADKLAEQCLEKAEVCRKDAVYAAAKTHQRRDTLQGYLTAFSMYGTIPGWKDADEQRAKAEKQARKKRLQRIIRISILSAVGLAIVFLIIYASVIVPNNRYKEANALYMAGQYREAIRSYRALDGYKNSEEMILLCETALKDITYEDALQQMKEGRYKRAITEFTILDDYKDSVQKLSECRYHYGTELFDAGRFKEASAEFAGADGFRNSREKAEEAYQQHIKEEMKTADVGDSVLFGRYEQDDTESNGREFIEWRVLDKTADGMFVISLYALDCLQYNRDNGPVTWESSSVRAWLNGTFFDSAFSTDEKRMIRTTTVTADPSPKYDTSAGNDTLDKVFLLSVSEVEEYTSLDYARQCEITEYCIAQGAYSKGTYRLSADDLCWWWLRSPGKYANYAAYTLTDGSIYYNGRIVDSSRGTVRPALWIEMGD